MTNPDRVELPFFVYGLFQKGQLGYLSLRDLVLGATPSAVKGTLRIRDGLPILDPDGNGEIIGTILEFKPGTADEAYSRITKIEPDKQYRWNEREAQGVRVNVLVGKSPRKGFVEFEGQTWDGAEDPLFTSALEVVEETLDLASEFAWDLKPLFRLQMAYLLLWSAIERYTSLRYHLGDKPWPKVCQLAEEPAFARALKEHARSPRRIFRADRPDQDVSLDPERPRKSIEYYYQVRSNITHRGKAVTRDHDTLRASLSELVRIFRDVLDSAFAEAQS